jgi:hypothetical protein
MEAIGPAPPGGRAAALGGRLRSRRAARRCPAPGALEPGRAALLPNLGAFEGYASWYGPGFAGRRTASGEVFDPAQLTAAHRTLPFGTRVRVVNVDQRPQRRGAHHRPRPLQAEPHHRPVARRGRGDRHAPERPGAGAGRTDRARRGRDPPRGRARPARVRGPIRTAPARPAPAAPFRAGGRSGGRARGRGATWARAPTCSSRPSSTSRSVRSSRSASTSPAPWRRPGSARRHRARRRRIRARMRPTRSTSADPTTTPSARAATRAAVAARRRRTPPPPAGPRRRVRSTRPATSSGTSSRAPVTPVTETA